MSPKDIVCNVYNENYRDIFNDDSQKVLMANGAIPPLA